MIIGLPKKNVLLQTTYGKSRILLAHAIVNPKIDLIMKWAPCLVI